MGLDGDPPTWDAPGALPDPLEGGQGDRERRPQPADPSGAQPGHQRSWEALAPALNLPSWCPGPTVPGAGAAEPERRGPGAGPGRVQLPAPAQAAAGHRGLPRRRGGPEVSQGRPPRAGRSPPDRQSQGPRALQPGPGVLTDRCDLHGPKPHRAGGPGTVPPAERWGQGRSEAPNALWSPSAGVRETSHSPRTPLSPGVGQPGRIWEFGHKGCSACFQLKPQLLRVRVRGVAQAGRGRGGRGRNGRGRAGWEGLLLGSPPGSGRGPSHQVCPRCPVPTAQNTPHPPLS